MASQALMGNHGHFNAFLFETKPHPGIIESAANVRMLIDGSALTHDAEEVVPLDVHGLPAGVYTVEAGGITQTFEFTVDNILPTEAPHEDQPTPPGTAQATDVQFVMAQQDVPIYGGSAQQYSIIGNIAAGQTAKVTGVTSDGTWWRVICPDGSEGDCWVSADPSLTQPAEAPQ